ncbi:CbiX/SirB N-terminal domain-containing protein [Pseudophaeobacter sp.]|uniref:sirohydrochlorin chelatase n=1 Tax=Pseudophaeobacter sp. TaxID=1971739 RepID=UPI00329805DF
MTDASQTVVLVSHGQPSAPQPPELALAKLANEVAQHLPAGWHLRSATLAQPGRLEEVMAEGALVYPFFMASGLFTTQILPRRLAGIAHRILPPFGADPALPQLTCEILRQEFKNLPATASKAKPAVLLAAHGSARGPKARQATERFAQTLRPLLPEAELMTGFIEEAPYLEDAARSLPACSLCLPFFAQAGDHVISDIPTALAEAGLATQCLPALGTYPQIAKLIARAILRDCARV